MKRLFEISALVSYHVVIAAETEEEALEHVKTWEHAWDANADLVEVADVDVFDVRDPYSQKIKALEDEAHIVL